MRAWAAEASSGPSPHTSRASPAEKSAPRETGTPKVSGSPASDAAAPVSHSSTSASIGDTAFGERGLGRLVLNSQTDSVVSPSCSVAVSRAVQVRSSGRPASGIACRVEGPSGADSATVAPVSSRTDTATLDGGKVRQWTVAAAASPAASTSTCRRSMAGANALGSGASASRTKRSIRHSPRPSLAN